MTVFSSNKFIAEALNKLEIESRYTFASKTEQEYYILGGSNVFAVISDKNIELINVVISVVMLMVYERQS